MNGTTEDIARAVRERRLVIFCGAGVSMLPPSRSPSWWEIYVAVTRALRERLYEGFGERAPTFDVDAILAPMTTQQLADVVVSRFAGNRFTEILTAVDVADCNDNHRAIASLAALGGVRAVITTNFDTMIERAAAVRELRMTVAAPGLPARPRPDTACVLVKLHGTSIEPATMIETSSQKATAVSWTLPAAWRPALPGAQLLVIGYSGADVNFGAAHAFFADVLAERIPIWWLHRPGAKPSLPEPLLRNVAFVEGGLPHQLDAVARTLSAVDIPTPLAGRDAHAALARAIDGWSRSPHVGRWGAACFFLALCDRAGEAGQPLNAGLMHLAREQARALAPGLEFDVGDIAVTTFLSLAGQRAMSRLPIDDAELLLRTNLNVLLMLDRMLAKHSGDESADERHSNLAGAWNNYALLDLLTGKKQSASGKFHMAMRHAYLGGHPTPFVTSLGNMLHYSFELADVRRCMRRAEAALAIADRVGAVDASIYLRLLLALYSCDRNEIWSARYWLLEARRRSAALGARDSVCLAEIQLGECALRAGRVADGLTAIAEALQASAHQVFISRPIEEVRRYLDTLGVRQEASFTIKLDAADVASAAERVEAERHTARAEGRLPWNGAHCRVSKSSAVPEDYDRALFQVGIFEFDENAGEAMALGLHIARVMLSRGYHFDAAWAARNVLLRPGAPTATLAESHTVAAHAYAALGLLDDAQLQLQSALRFLDDAPGGVVTELIGIGTWFHIQCGNVATAVEWAERWARAVDGNHELLSEVYAEAARVDTWGDVMAPVAETLRALLGRYGITVPRGSGDVYRRFTGATVFDADSHAEADAILRKALEALRAGKRADASALLDKLNTLDDLPEHQLGVAISLQIHALLPELSHEQLTYFAAHRREEMLDSLSFTALTRLETALVWAKVESGEWHQAHEILVRHGWIAEFADDPIARTSLQSWLAHLADATGRRLQRNPRASRESQLASYFGVPEAQLADPEQEDGHVEQADLATATARELEAAYATVESAQAADEALRTAVRRLRSTRKLTRGLLARLRGARANWALQRRELTEAAALYRRVQRSFRRLGLLRDALNAMAGEARALSRAGAHYEDAVRLFEQAIAEDDGGGLAVNLRLGLGSTHLLEATERRAHPDIALVDKAIALFREAIARAQPDSLERAFAKLAAARAFGERGDQTTALETFDQAVAELAHQGAPQAKLLIDHRNQFVAGQWRTLALH